MKPEEAMVGGVLAIILGLVTWTAGSTLYRSGAPVYEVWLLCAAIVFAGIAFAGMVKILPRATMYFSIGTLLCTIAFLILHYHLVPLCGDSICSTGECASCAADCTPAQCENNKCERPLESCINSKDCSCQIEQACAPGRAGSDERGCAAIRCGDGICDAGETAQSCCGDCSCGEGFLCQSNRCIFQRPVITVKPYQLNSTIAVTSLVGNPELRNDSGVPRPLVGMRIHTTGFVRALNVTFVVGDLINDTRIIGTLEPGAEVPVLWSVPPDTHLLALTEDRRTNITITVQYLDGLGDRHSTKLLLPLTLYGRNTLDPYGHIVLFVTNDIRTAASTPQGIWDELRENMSITAISPRIQFPYETLRAKAGSARDMALLVASAYERAGLNPALVQGIDGSLYVRIKLGDRYAMIDPSMINSSFDQALISRPGAVLYNIQRVRAEKGYRVLALNESFIAGANVKATTILEQSCVCTTHCGTKALAVHTITNYGFAPARVCAISTIQAGEQEDVKQSCFALNPSSSADFRHGWQHIKCERAQASVSIR